MIVEWPPTQNLFFRSDFKARLSKEQKQFLQDFNIDFYHLQVDKRKNSKTVPFKSKQVVVECKTNMQIILC